MEKDLKSGEQIDSLMVKTQLDEILASKITSLIDVDSDVAMMSFNLATISCIIVIVEREREIKQYTEFPPERYNLESFINELVDIGLERDDYLETAVVTSLSSGYIGENEKGEFKAEMSAFMTAGFLDSMFPGMQGMNLIAYVLQMNHEVNSGRKTLELAKQSFEASLKSSGVAVSQDHAEKRASEMASGTQKSFVKTKEISEKLKKENIDRLSTLMKTRKKRSGEYKEKLQVKDVFDKGPSKEEIAAQKAEIEKIEEIAKKEAELARQLAEKDEQIKQAEEAAKEAAKQLKELEEKELALKIAQEKAEELAAREAQMAEKEANLKAMEERLKQKEEDEARREEEARLQDIKAQEEKESVTSEEDIESQIAAFESELAMPCPLCEKGQIEEKTTEKGKQFFTCTKAECRFVSWDKPYHFECPLCKNSFLIEMQAAGDVKGIKCPRAACSYTQDNLLDPKQNMASAIASSKPKKKKKMVRRIKRR
ncbi:MAG: DNA topoisomerase I [Desulfobacteraceae bacterium]|nr:DNA topoisomerase I [Desulfobacteraceae bacterium]